MKKKLLAILLAVALVLPLCPVISLPVFAATSGTTGSCTWTLDGTVLTISGNGAMGNYSSSSTLPWGTAITEVVIEDGVTKIGSYAFYECYSLSSVTIGDSVTSIGNGAFDYCRALTSITIGNSVTSIGARSFEWCAFLTSVTIPDSVTSIGDGAFYSCESLASITIPEGVTSIGDDAFGWCTTLTSITIGDSVTSIGNYAFGCCTTLTSITIGDSVTSIGNYAFYNCNSLTDVWYVGDRRSVANITIGTNNTPLTSATWHYLDSYCDEDCNTCGEKNPLAHKFDNVCDESCNLCGKIREVPEHSYTWIIDLSENCGRDGKKHEACSSCGIKRNENTLIPATGNHVYTSDCDEACNVCGTLRTPSDHVYDNIIDKTCNVCGLTRPLPYNAYGTTGDCIWALKGTVLTISGTGAMANHDIFNLPPWGEDLTEIVIEDGVTALGSDAFSYNASLITITIPKSVKTVGEYAFDGCNSLTDVWYEGTEADKASLTIGGSNAPLTSATWHYDSCVKSDTKAHSYDNACDTTCNICGVERTLPYDSYGTTGDCFWYKEGTKLTIFGNGAMEENYKPWGTDITEVVIEDGVTTIGECAFFCCYSLASVTIPDSVTSIGNNAFFECITLSSITIPDSVTTIGYRVFANCGNLNSIMVEEGNPVYHSSGNCLIETETKELIQGSKNSVIPSDGSVTRIGDNSFVNCIDLTSITIPDSVTTIGYRAFAACGSLISVTIGNSVTSIGDEGFYGCSSLPSITIPGSVTSIGEFAFGRCDSLTSVTIPDSVTSIGNVAFYKCGSLTSVVIPDSVTSIGNEAFFNCESLTTVTIPDSVTSIGDYAFYNCGSLTDVWYEGTEENRALISIGSKNECLTSATWHCKECEHIYDNRVDTTCNICGVERTLPYDSYGTTGDCFWYKEGTKLTIFGNGAMEENYKPWGTDITEVVIEDGVTTIGECAFFCCYSLTSITIPDSVTSIGAGIFSECTSLASITIPDGVTSIGNGAFFNCTSLTTVTIPDSVTSIGNHAFDRNTGLTSIIIGNGVTSIGDYAFMRCGNLTSITVAEGNSVYHSDGNCLIETESKTLIQGCNNSVIPADGSVTTIGDYAFSGCTGLTSISIPDSVTGIGSLAFYNCTSLTDVWYEGTEADKASLTIGVSNAALTSATWHYNYCAESDTKVHVYDNNCDTTCNLCDYTRTTSHTFDNDCDTTCGECGFVRVTLHTPVNGVCTECGQKAVFPVSAQLVLDKYIGVKFYFNKTDVDEDFTFLVTLPGRDEPLAEGAFSDLIEDGKYYVLSFNGIGLSDFNTEFTLSGKTLWDPNAGRYNSVYKLATIGANHYTDGSKADKLFKSIVDLGKAAVGEDTEYDLTFKAETPASSGQGPEEGAALRFTGKNLLMNDTIALRLYGEADTAEAIDGIKVIFNNKYNVTRMCDVSAPVYNEAKGKYTFTVDIFFSTSTMEEAITITVNDGNGLRCLELNDRIDWIAQTILAREPQNTLAKQVLIYIQKANEYFDKTPPVATPSLPGTETELGGGVEV